MFRRMTEYISILVVGLGHIGRPLFEIVKGVYPEAMGYDVTEGEFFPKIVDVLHICFGYSKNFKKIAFDYIKATKPRLVCIESTVIPGTTKEIVEMIADDKDICHSNIEVVHSPVRGRDADGMKWGYFNYTKFVGAENMDSACSACDYYRTLGFKVWVCKSSLESEFVKILDLAYFAVMLGFNQDMRRIAEQFKLEFRDVDEFFETNGKESNWRFPRPIFDGEPIGGHCTIPAVEMLQQVFPSPFLDSVLASDKARKFERGHNSLE